MISNRGPCQLRVSAITSSNPVFVPPGVAFYPIIVDAGDSITVPVRFQPTALGPVSGTLTVFGNDPSGPRQVHVSGNAPGPRLVVSIADSGGFGHVCVDHFRDESLTLSNSGCCPLTITSMTTTDPQFVVPIVDAFPIVVEPGDEVDVELRFQPASFGPKNATITITSDDPAGPDTLDVSGYAPSGHLVITGSGHFGPVDFGRRAEREITLHNSGECDLHVLAAGFLPDPWKPGCSDCDTCAGDEPCGCTGGGHHPKHGHDDRDNHDDRYHGKQPDQDGVEKKSSSGGESLRRCCGPFKVVSNPFPATIRPGASLPILIRFTATCSGPKCCELVILTDDPDVPNSTVYVTGSLHRTLRSALKCWAADEIQVLLRAGSHPC